MSLEALSGSSYHDSAKVAKNTDFKSGDTQIQNPGAMNLRITEIPVKKVITEQATAEQEKGKRDNSASEKHIKDAISRANSRMKHQRTKCEFSYHEDTKRVSIKVIDKDTEEVIREIPPEETLEMIEKMWELAGLLVDEKR